MKVLTLGLLLFSLGIFGAEVDAQEKPNVILIVADDLGYGDLPSYGNTKVLSPALDRLAEQGLKLTQFYVTAPGCTPSRSGLLTGRYPHRNGLYDMIRNDRINYGYRFPELEYTHSEEMTLGLDVREKTIARFLSEAGYYTGIVGKWDSGRSRQFLPLQRGFDFFYGFANTGIDYYTHERYGVPSMYRGNQRIKDEGYATDLFRDEALRFLDQAEGRPFFLYLPFNAPHGPSNLERTGPQAPDEYIRLYTEPPADELIRYYANISCMDAAIDKILQKVKALGVEENTLVIFTSDNGGTRGKNDPLRSGKAHLYEGGVRVPFIAKWPGKIPAGETDEGFVTALEILPTLLEVAKIDIPADLKLDGKSILSFLTGDAPSPRNEMYWEFQSKRAARVGNWKWVFELNAYELPTPGYVGELYDLSQDVEEQHNLAAERPELEREMKEKWEAWMREMAQSEVRGPFSHQYFELLGFDVYSDTTGFPVPE